MNESEMIIHNYMGITYYLLGGWNGDRVLPGYSKYQYKWKHLPTGKTGISEVAIYSYSENYVLTMYKFCTLLVTWANENWIYQRCNRA